MAVDPKTSAGARLERKAFREYLRRKLGTVPEGPNTTFLLDALQWVLGRQKRYDSKSGGLGRKAAK